MFVVETVHRTVLTVHHGFRRCLETSNLTLPEEQPAADTKWSRRQLREACSEHAEDPAWWEKLFPGWECVKIQIFDPGGLHENAEPRPEGWEATEPQAYSLSLCPSREGKQTTEQE